MSSLECMPGAKPERDSAKHQGGAQPSEKIASLAVARADILKASLLIVDDLDANVLLLKRTLEGGGYTSITSTTNPLEVCELHRTHHYDLILLDLQMPVMDGFQVMASLKEIETDGYLPVLVITAQPDQKLRALRAGAKDFISKPFDLAEVLARVYNMLEVRLLHLEMKKYSKTLEETIQELDASREVLRLKSLEEQKKSEQELVLAQQTQESLLPRSLPEFENFHIHAFNHPTRYVGGDFYDFRKLSSGEWVGVLADVSGKGMFAALLSSMVLGALSMEFRSRAEPQEVLHRVNELLCEKSLPSQFVTLFFFLLNPDGIGQFISAGHCPAYLFRSATGKIEELVSGSCVLGMFDTVPYPSRPFQLDKGDILVVYSDGLTDAQNPHEEMFGEERLLRIIREEAPSGSHALEQKFLNAIEEFTQGTPQTDDITFIVVEKYQ
jgi:serine phosphatase RsbU (regulator of sigma subunit)